MKYDFVAFDASKVYAGNVFYYVVLYFLNPAKQSFYLHLGNVDCETMDVYSKIRNKVYFYYKRKNYVHAKSYQSIVLVSIDPILTYSSFKKRLLCRVFYDKLQEDTTYPSQWAVLQPWVATRNYTFSCIVSVDVNVVDRRLNSLSEYFAKKSCFINYLEEIPQSCVVNYCHRDENVKITLHNSIGKLNRQRAIDEIEDLFDKKNRLFSRYYRKTLISSMFRHDAYGMRKNKHRPKKNSGNQIQLTNLLFFLLISISVRNGSFCYQLLPFLVLVIPIENFEFGYSCDKTDTSDIIITHGSPRGHRGPLIKMSYKTYRSYCMTIAIITLFLLFYLLCLQIYYYLRLNKERLDVMNEIMERFGMPPDSFVNDDYSQPARDMTFIDLNNMWFTSVSTRIANGPDENAQRNSVSRSRYSLTPDYLIDVKKSAASSNEEIDEKISKEIEQKIHEQISKSDTYGMNHDDGHVSFPVTPSLSTKALKNSTSTNSKTGSKMKNVTFNAPKRRKLSLSTTFSSIGGSIYNLNASNKVRHQGLPNSMAESQFTNIYAHTQLTNGNNMATDDEVFTEDTDELLPEQRTEHNTYGNTLGWPKTKLKSEEKVKNKKSSKKILDRSFKSYDYINDQEETPLLLKPNTI